MILGKISAVDDANGLQLIIDGEETPTQKKYRYLASYVPAAGDKVAIEESGGSYVVMGKLIDSTEMAGIAKKAAEADHAATATSATTADTASNATNAASDTSGKSFLTEYGVNLMTYSRYGKTYLCLCNSSGKQIDKSNSIFLY